MELVEHDKWKQLYSNPKRIASCGCNSEKTMLSKRDSWECDGEDRTLHHALRQE